MSALINLFYIYDPWVMHFIRMAFVAGAFSCVLLAYRWYQKRIDGIRVPVDSVAVIFALIALSAVPLLINGTKDFSVLIMYSKTLILFGFGIVIYNLFYSRADKQNQLVNDLKWGIGTQALIGILGLTGIAIFSDIALGTNMSLFLPKFRGSEQEYRLYNITSAAFFQLSAFYLMLLNFMLAYNAKHNNMHGVFVLLILFIGVISGRTFFTFSVLSILLYFKWRYVPYLLLFVAIVLGLAIYLPEHPYVAHALEPVINILSGADRVSSSTDTLMNKHLFLPEIKQILMGDGYYYTPELHYYGGSDSGFIRQTLYGGLGYVFVCFAFTAYFVKRIADNWFDGSWKFTLSTLFILSVLNIKADTYAYPGIMLVLLMFLSLFGDKGKQIVLLRRKDGKNV
ncbi:hypothetical protein NYR70_01120 [Actinobacillus equuli subsp. equuli]|uniref:hypothetical protein n=1 Tax=Actinobacillus equuli TaxID=718 RepID=UPI002443560E|nr:hypothetical protein [Actinobacillus equuli]WGE55309.1 hypothetical protein NYR70_01120 [Actinobacillus equuli subsp. equuli]